MEPEGSLQRSQKIGTYSCYWPNESSLHFSLRVIGSRLVWYSANLTLTLIMLTSTPQLSQVAQPKFEYLKLEYLQTETVEILVKFM